MEPFSLVTRLTPQDWRAYQSACMRRLRHQDEGGAFFGEQAYEFRAEGFHTNRHGVNSFSSWSMVKSISATAEHLFIWIDKFQGFVVPLRDLPAGVGREEIIRQLEEWAGRTVEPDVQWNAAGRAPAADGSATVVATEDGGRGGSPGWFATLLRLLTLRSAPDMPARASAGLIGLLVCIALGIWVGVDWLANLPDPEFYVYGVTEISWYALMLLAIAAVLARRSVPAVDLGRVLSIALAGTAVLIVALFLIDRYLSWPWTLVASLLLFFYFILYAARSLRAISGRAQPTALVIGIAVAVGFLWGTQWLYVDPSVWSAPDDEDEAGYESTWKESESLLFAQSERIDAAIDRIAPSTGALPAVFFVGFAGYGEQRVFAEEIELAARVVGQRYGLQGSRSVFLVNDRRSLDAQPLASPTALRYALRRLAGKMNIERDTLFLSLSSHGSVGVLSVSNGPLMLQDLTADDLASALEESGIKWRVIVISACHAGSFIDALRNPNTIVITAAEADKTSFGCSDDRNLTYFGEAFYRDAMPRAKSLREAFEMAKAAIVAREERERIDASNPQAFFGEAIEKHLGQLERPPEGRHTAHR